MRNYIIISGCYLSDMEEEVNDRLADGYALVGGISVSTHSEDSSRSPVAITVYCQAMAMIAE